MWNKARKQFECDVCGAPLESDGVARATRGIHCCPQCAPSQMAAGANVIVLEAQRS